MSTTPHHNTFRIKAKPRTLLSSSRQLWVLAVEGLTTGSQQDGAVDDCGADGFVCRFTGILHALHALLHTPGFTAWSTIGQCVYQ